MHSRKRVGDWGMSERGMNVSEKERLMRARMMYIIKSWEKERENKTMTGLKLLRSTGIKCASPGYVNVVHCLPMFLQKNGAEQYGGGVTCLLTWCVQRSAVCLDVCPRHFLQTRCSCHRARARTYPHTLFFTPLFHTSGHKRASSSHGVDVLGNICFSNVWAIASLSLNIFFESRLSSYKLN